MDNIIRITDETNNESSVIAASAKAVKTVNDNLDNSKWQGSSKIVSTAEPSGGTNGDIWFQYIN